MVLRRSFARQAVAVEQVRRNRRPRPWPATLRETLPSFDGRASSHRGPARWRRLQERLPPPKRTGRPATVWMEAILACVENQAWGVGQSNPTFVTTGAGAN